MATTPTLHAILIGINDYPIFQHRLHGCRNDAALIDDYLGLFAKEAGMGYRPFQLIDSDASRAGILQSFGHFKQAVDGDTCVFYYSGHGSKAAAPPEFWDESDRMNESIVCHDSRLEGGLDLLDKELSYLIWEATKGKNLHFAAIMDCCFAGTNTRGLARSRMAEPAHLPKTVEEYHGYSFYKKTERNGNILLSPPSGKHVHLAASRDNETAKERSFDGEQHGAFTHALVKAMAGNGPKITYGELMRLVNIHLGQTVADQHAQVASIGEEYANTSFLNGSYTNTKRQFMVRYAGSSWRLDAGALHGIGQGASLELEGGGEVVVVDKHPLQAKVKGMDGHDLSKTYMASLGTNGQQALVLGFSEDCEEAGCVVFRQSLAKKNSTLLALTEEPAKAAYLVHARADSYFLALPGTSMPLFKRSNGFNESGCMDFLENVERVARWTQLLELCNGFSSIETDEYSIELYCVENPKLGDESEAILVDLQAGPPILEYLLDKYGQFEMPAIRLRIANTGKRNFWVSTCYMDSNFGVYNALLPKKRLGPGHDAWLSFMDQYGELHQTIQLFVPDEYATWGISEITDYLKVFICTDEFDTNDFCQEPLALEAKKGFRGMFNLTSTNFSMPDWVAKTIELKVRRPCNTVAINDETPVVLPNLRITPHPKFKASASLASLEEVERGEVLPKSLKLAQPMVLSRGLAQTPGMAVLELRAVSDSSDVNPSSPLVMEIGGESDGGIVPIGIDKGSGLLYPLGFQQADGKIIIERLPSATASGNKSLMGSLKIFFMKQISPITGSYPYPVIAAKKLEADGGISVEMDTNHNDRGCLQPS